MKSAFLLLVLLVTAVFVSCVDPESPGTTRIKVSKMTMRTENRPLDTAIYLFDYSVNNEINIRNGNSSPSVRYIFDLQNRISEIQLKNSSGKLLYKVSFSYAGETATKLNFDYTATPPHREDSTIFYLGSGGLATHSVDYMGTIKPIRVDTVYYTWANHDLVGMIMKYEGKQKSVTLTYDNSFNPLWISELPIEFFLTFGSDFFYACNKHNMIEAKLSTGESVFQTESREYNPENYLTGIVTDIQAEQGKFETHFEYIPK